ncbi:hypothetical protein GCM10023168_03380 [Fodinibacter luteus]|uniref:Uncharacterized protein n=1 Tax=Fodinibacter luteus TaxID=552064 RepID=A0ABP8JY50_9MICO
MGIAEHRDGLLKLTQVLVAEDDGIRAAVAGDGDPLASELHAVHDLAEVVAYLVKRFEGHGHQCAVRVGSPCGQKQGRPV